MKAFIEQVEAGHKNWNLPLGIVLKEKPDILDISNKGDTNFISYLFGYRQLGQFKVNRPHDFHEREWVDIDMVNKKITAVRKL
jgi:hypothetical protein